MTLKTNQTFKKKLNLLKDLVKKKGFCFIPGGRNEYKVISITDEFVIILQKETEQKHKIIQLKELYLNGSFKAPRKPISYDTDTRTGHLLMKNAIVSYLENS